MGDTARERREPLGESTVYQGAPGENRATFHGRPRRILDVSNVLEIPEEAHLKEAEADSTLSVLTC